MNVGESLTMLQKSFVKEFIRTAEWGANQGWHERNGGNLSYRLTPEEAAAVKALNPTPKRDWLPIGTEVPGLAGELFLVTGTGRHLRHVALDPEENICVAELDGVGERYRILWGLRSGGRPTSEFGPHLMNHEVCVARTAGRQRVIYHAHPVNLIAMTFVLPLTDRDFTRALWEVMTECPVIFPEGVGVVPWMVPGGRAIAIETSKLMKSYNIAVWAHHGLFVSAENFGEAFGLMETVEKAAEIWMKVQSSGLPKRSCIDTPQLRELAKDFHLTLPERFL